MTVPQRRYRQKIDPMRDACPVRAALDVVRGRWKPLLLFELHLGTRRFSELQKKLQGASPQALALQLRQLEADGVIVRRVYAAVPPRVEYSLTPLGSALGKVMDELTAWGSEYLKSQRGNPGS